MLGPADAELAGVGLHHHVHPVRAEVGPREDSAARPQLRVLGKQLVLPPQRERGSQAFA